MEHGAPRRGDQFLDVLGAVFVFDPTKEMKKGIEPEVDV